MAKSSTQTSQKRKKQPNREDFINWIRHRPCLMCGNSTYHDELGQWLTDPAHILTRGAVGTSQDVGNIVPLCRRCHTEQHQIGIKSFEKKFDVNLEHWGKVYARLFENALNSDENPF